MRGRRQLTEFEVALRQSRLAAFGERLVAGPGGGIPPRTFGFTLLLGLLAALPPLAIDISAPTLLVVQGQMAASTRVVGLVITVFMVGFGAGQFAAGPASDRRGRRPVLLLGLFSYMAASVGCALAGSITGLLCWRLVQGVGAGACAVLTFATIRDLFEGDEARAKRSYVTVVFGIAPMLAPLLGAWILAVWGWRAVYVLLGTGALGLLAVVWRGLAESRPAVEGAAVPQAIWQAYRSVLASPRFAGLVGVNALSFGTIFTYIAASPLVLMGAFGLSPGQYGEVFACTAATLTAGAWVSGRCAQLGMSSMALLWAGLGLSAVSGAVLAGLMLGGVTGLAWLMPPLLLCLFARGITAPNLQHVALEPMREQAGAAAAAIGVVQILFGAACSAVVAALLPVLGAGAMGACMAVLSVAGLVAWAGLQGLVRAEG